MTRAESSVNRLMARIKLLGEFGAPSGVCVCRLALTDEYKPGRYLLVSWTQGLGRKIPIDVIGNIWGTRDGERERLLNSASKKTASGEGLPAMCASMRVKCLP